MRPLIDSMAVPEGHGHRCSETPAGLYLGPKCNLKLLQMLDRGSIRAALYFANNLVWWQFHVLRRETSKLRVSQLGSTIPRYLAYPRWRSIGTIETPGAVTLPSDLA